MTVRISRPDYDKPFRCPGWSGAGWRFNKHDWCDNMGPDRWSPKVYDQMWRLNWFRRTTCCGTAVRPLWIRWFEVETWRWEWTKRQWRKEARR